MCTYVLGTHSFITPKQQMLALPHKKALLYLENHVSAGSFSRKVCVRFDQEIETMCDKITCRNMSLFAWYDNISSVNLQSLDAALH